MPKHGLAPETFLEEHDLLCNSPDIAPGLAVWEWDIPANAVRYSREWLWILRDSDPALLGPDPGLWWRRVHETDRLPVLDVSRSIIEGRSEEYRALFRLRRTDGAWIWLFSRGRVAAQENGRATLVRGAVMDVSTLRADVKFLHGAALTWIKERMPAESAPDLVVSMDEELAPLFSNPNLADALAGRRDVWPGHPAPALAAPNDGLLAFLRRNIRQVMDEGRPLRELITLPTDYGHDVTGEYSFWPEYDGTGRVTAVKTHFRDLTERVLAERRARRNEMQLEALYRLTQMDNATEDEVLRFALDSVIELTESKGGFLFFPDTLLAAPGRMIWAPGEYRQVDLSRLSGRWMPPDVIRHIAGKEGREVRLIRNGNGLQPVLMGFGGQVPIMRYLAAPALDLGRVVCIASVCNKRTEYTEADLQQMEAFITSTWHILRRHEFVRELRRAKDAAEHANRIKDAFIANVSHELRTPLNGMLGMLQLLELMPLTEQQQEYVRTAGGAGQTLMRIISDILDYSRMESGKMTLQREVFNLEEVLRAPLDMLRSQAESKGLVFETRFDRAIPTLLTGDDARIRQLVFNVVGNAVKFTERGGIEFDCRLVSSDAGHARVSFRVSDTGVGIAPELQESMFEAFTQAENPCCRKNQGTGLGLSVVRGLIELMNGQIRLESEPGQGTTVSWILPLALPAKPLPAPRKTRRGRRSAVPGRLDILVAEDDAVSSFVLYSFLRKVGHRAVCVDSGSPALEALMLYPFHCLFTDIQMPDMDGLELVRRIRENDPGDVTPTDAVRECLRAVIPGRYARTLPLPKNLITVAISAHAMSGDKKRFLNQGMDFYIPKPIIMEDLQDLLDRIARRLGHMAERRH